MTPTTKNKYPVYIVSKGRWETPLTARMFMEDGVDFLIVIEPQELEFYKKTIPEKNILVTDFANLGVGSYPARNFAWEHAQKNGHKMHWVFDDNIRYIKRLHKGKRIRVNASVGLRVAEDFTDRYKNIGITGLNYTNFAMRTTTKPFFINVHAYSGMLIRNDLPFRWRMKYNEDIDLCFQVLNTKYWCTILINTFLIDKMSTSAKMKGGNQTELYKGNAHEMKLIKARSIQEIWPQYCEVVYKYGRPHHSIDWKSHFKHVLIRDPKFDWAGLEKANQYGLKLKKT